MSNQKYMPTQPLDALLIVSSRGAAHWRLERANYTDAEFAAHFVPADTYERLMAAAAEEVFTHATDGLHSDPCPCDLCAAWRAYRGDE